MRLQYTRERGSVDSIPALVLGKDGCWTGVFEVVEAGELEDDDWGDGSGMTTGAKDSYVTTR